LAAYDTGDIGSSAAFDPWAYDWIVKAADAVQVRDELVRPPRQDHTTHSSKKLSLLVTFIKY
jgi:hypothetical protein